MSLLVITRFTIDPRDAAELRARHAALVASTRERSAGLTEARLGRLSDESWLGVWRWTSPEHLRAARESAPDDPTATAAFSLARGITAEEVQLVDEH
ncbi:antibiotic biosynthesis monooxygenase [Plantactinospora sp. GCM10030261]|uniref:antibiotic biosynthesis monooxygenase n=1 Tax=Plantactinospora sp. GCM10030261 TaxID=3273420 RepID=UPI003610D08D